MYDLFQVELSNAELHLHVTGGGKKCVKALLHTSKCR